MRQTQSRSKSARSISHPLLCAESLKPQLTVLGYECNFGAFILDIMPASTYNNRMKINDIVKYSKPQKGEEEIRFVLREINDDRVLIELICDWPIKPTEVVAINEVCNADE